MKERVPCGLTSRQFPNAFAVVAIAGAGDYLPISASSLSMSSWERFSLAGRAGSALGAAGAGPSPGASPHRASRSRLGHPSLFRARSPRARGLCAPSPPLSRLAPQGVEVRPAILRPPEPAPLSCPAGGPLSFIFLIDEPHSASRSSCDIRSAIPSFRREVVGARSPCLNSDRPLAERLNKGRPREGEYQIFNS